MKLLALLSKIGDGGLSGGGLNAVEINGGMEIVSCNSNK